MTGNVLDVWTLRKPANWEANLVVRNVFEQYFISNYTAGGFLENTGTFSATFWKYIAWASSYLYSQAA